MVYLSLQLVMIPLQAWCFYEIPLFAFLPNLFAGAVMTAVLLPGAAGLLAGLASVKAGSVVLLPARFLLTLLRQMTAAVAQIPGNVWICGQPEKWQMAGYGIILTGLLVILYVRKRKRKRERMLFGITMFFACVLLFYRPRETFSITALDVLPYLKQRGIAALDAVVVTHPDADHTNGILELLELIGEQKTALRIRHLFLPVWMKGSEKENPFILAAQKAGIMVEYLKKGDEIRAGELTVSVLHPGAGEDYTGEENAGSVVLQLSCGACRALLTGDLEGSGEEEVLGAAERCQILKVAHHGSRNSTSEAFLNRIQPQISLISCAWPGRYGHPHRELLERLRACKSHIYGTPVDGAVTVRLKRDRLAVHGYRSDVEFPVS